jgi:hypothetical protein
VRRASVLLALLSGLSSPALAAGADTLPPTRTVPPCPQAAMLPPTASEQDIRITCEIPGPFRLAVQTAEREGGSLRFLDIAGWLSTDALRAKNAFAAVPGQPVGWLVLQRSDGFVVPYFTRLPDGKLAAFAEARMGAKGVAHATSLSPPRPATEDERRLLAARALALSSPRLQCTSAVNASVRETRLDGAQEIRVYVTSAWSDEAAPLGGFEEFRIDADGTKILSRQPHTRGCLNVDPARLRSGDGVAVTELSATTPTAFHVLLSLQYATPLHVLTTRNDTLWTVTAGRIGLSSPAGEFGRRLLAWQAEVGRRPTDPDRTEETLP